MEQRPTAVVSGHKDRPGRTTPAPSTGPAAISWTSDDRSPKGPSLTTASPRTTATGRIGQTAIYSADFRWVVIALAVLVVITTAATAGTAAGIGRRSRIRPNSERSRPNTTAPLRGCVIGVLPGFGLSRATGWRKKRVRDR
ncbi:hypothetical protein ACFQX6_03135 [Streptosporangium lutulentum]